MANRLRRVIQLSFVGGMWLCWLLGAGSSPGFAQAQSYTIDSSMSDIAVIVNRSGVLAILAHDHVVEFKSVEGQLKFSAPAFDNILGGLSIAVGSAVVDDADRRVRESLAGDLDLSNRNSVLENMLGPEVLDAANFPTITANLRKLESTPPDGQATIALTIKDTTRMLTFPVKIEQDGERVTVSGEFELVQSEFAIDPYSSLLGSIAVADTLLVKFVLKAYKSSR